MIMTGTMAAEPLVIAPGTLPQPDLLAGWQALSETLPGASLFAGPGFQMALRRAFAPQDPVAAVVLRDQGGVAGLTPLTRRRAGRGQLGFTETGFFRNAHTLRNHLLMPAEDAPLRAFLRATRDLAPWDVFFLENLPADPAPLARLAAAATALGMAADPPEPCRSLDFADLTGGYDAYLATRSGDHRRQIRKRVREMQAAGRAEVICLTGAEVATGLEDWFAVEAQSWQGASPDTAMSAADRDFHRLLAAEPQPGDLWLIRLDDAPIAALRMLEDRRGLYVHTMHFDQARRDLAPGIVLFDAMLSAAAARGVARVDFNGSSEFFARWATGTTPQVQFRLYAPGARGLALRLARKLRQRWRKVPG